MSELSHENVLIQVKDALTTNGVKLWLPPYYLEMESNESEIMVRNFLKKMLRILLIDSLFLDIQKLAEQFTQSLNIKYEYCLAALNELQNHAIDKLQANKELKEEGDYKKII